MAKRDESFRPDLSRARQYDDYHRYRNAQRERWERSERFINHWQEKIFVLAEKEGRRLGLRMDDSMASWDVWYNRVVVPMKNLFWEAWEHHCELASRFAEATRPETAETSNVLSAAEVYAERLGQLWGHAQSAAADSAA